MKLKTLIFLEANLSPEPCVKLANMALLTSLVPCWGFIKNDHFYSLLGFYYNKNVNLYPTGTQVLCF